MGSSEDEEIREQVLMSLPSAAASAAALPARQPQLLTPLTPLQPTQTRTPTCQARQLNVAQSQETVQQPHSASQLHALPPPPSFPAALAA